MQNNDLISQSKYDEMLKEIICIDEEVFFPPPIINKV